MMSKIFKKRSENMFKEVQNSKIKNNYSLSHSHLIHLICIYPIYKIIVKDKIYIYLLKIME